METSFGSLAIVAAAGFAAPLVLGLVSQLRLPSVVLEIVLGILIGPSVLLAILDVNRNRRCSHLEPPARR